MHSHVVSGPPGAKWGKEKKNSLAQKVYIFNKFSEGENLKFFIKISSSLISIKLKTSHRFVTFFYLKSAANTKLLNSANHKLFYVLSGCRLTAVLLN